MNIAITDEAVKRLNALLEDEGEDAVVRIRETQVGPP
jgi:Fe-S cluster assembly iron-binding protein IscA